MRRLDDRSQKTIVPETSKTQETDLIRRNVRNTYFEKGWEIQIVFTVEKSPWKDW